MQYSTFEEVLEDAGPFGRYQQFFVFLTQLTVVAYCGNYVFMTYAIVEPNYKCQQYRRENDQHLGNVANLTALMSSSSTFQHKNATLVEHSNLTTCDILKTCSKENITVTRDFFGIIEEWELQCAFDYLPNLILTLERTGSLVGSQIGGYLADHLGRRLIFLICHSVGIFLSFSCVMSQGWLSFAIFRTLIGFLMAASSVCFFTWGMELTNSNHNIVMNLAGNWQFIYMSSALIGYLTGSWRRYLICINLIAILAIPTLMLYGESPRWLIQQKRIEEAAKSINIMQRWNRNKKDKPIELIQAQSLLNIRVDLTDRHYTFVHLFHSRELAIYTVVLSMLTFAASIVANTFLFNLRHLAGNPFMDIFIYGALRSWMPFAIYAADWRFPRFGRKLLFYIGVGTVLGCLVMVVVLFEIEVSPGSNLNLITVFGVAAAGMCAPIWTCIGQYQVELYPTVIRNIAGAFSAIAGEIGGLLAPQIIYLEKSWESLPYLVNTLIVFVALVTGGYFLPETKGRNLPDLLQNTVALPDAAAQSLGSHPTLEDTFSLVDHDQLANSSTAKLLNNDVSEEIDL